MLAFRLTRLHQRAIAFCAGIGCMLLVSCSPRPTKEVPVRETSVPAAIDLPAVLGQMPTNSDERCMGISMVMKALMDGKPDGTSSYGSIPGLAKRIYASMTNGERLRFSPQITSRAGLEELCTRVADAYKQDYRRAVETTAGRERLLAAETNFLRTARELEQQLMTDAVAYVGSGTRYFDDGTTKETHHAFLLAKQGKRVVVFDPNDLGQTIACNLEETDGGLVVEWKCRYRDTQQVTTQGYRIVPLSQYLRDGLGK